MSIVHSFSPVSSTNARVLVLGSMPGGRSLEKDQYYAHSKNGFWEIMGQLFDFSVEATYEERCAGLRKNKVALWDVLKSCERKGSLDSAIQNSSIVVNDFKSFFQLHSEIQLIFFNGAKADAVFQKYVPEDIQQQFPKNTQKRLPSTSPAYAAMNLRDKMKKWSLIKERLPG